MGARYYDTSGMFTQPDALTGNLSDPRTMTAYNYAYGDPINKADPSGYRPGLGALGEAFATGDFLVGVGDALASGDTSELVNVVAAEAIGLGAEVACNAAIGYFSGGTLLASAPAVCGVGGYAVGAGAKAVLDEINP